MEEVLHKFQQAKREFEWREMEALNRMLLEVLTSETDIYEAKPLDTL